jgi:hypothetical protein
VPQLIRSFASLVVLAALINSASSFADAPAVGASAPSAIPPNVISEVAAHIIAAEIPREYERSKDWGRTKEMTTGVRSSGNFFKFDVHRTRSQVNDGVWKKYKLTLVEPEKNLNVSIENVRTLEGGHFALTLNVTAKVHGWARIKVYESGVHIIAVEAEGDTNVKLSVGANIGVQSVMTSAYLPGIAVDPTVTDVRIKFKDFELRRISDVRGTLAHELGILLREAVEDELKGPKLAERINAAIRKHPERLQLTPEMLIGKVSAKPTSADAASTAK